MTAPLTQTLGRFASELTFEKLPAEAVEVVKTGFTDTIAVMLAGRDEPVAKIVRDSLGSRGASKEARLLLGDQTANSADAALANAVAGHALDYDDVSLGGHPSVVLVPAVLAEAEALGRSGKEAVAAYVAGYETWAHLIEREKDPYHRKGWHPTAVMGPVAAAAAVANLRKLDPETATMALGIAASLSAGVVANFGTMTKPFQAGRAAQSGVTAARLAEAGLTSAADALEHAVGLMRALSPQGNVDTETPLLPGRDWLITKRRLNVKKYPMCYGTHRAIDGMLDLVVNNNLKPEDVERIEVTIGKTQTAMLRNHQPVTGLEAKFSIEFAIATSLAARRAGLQQLTDEFVNKPEVQSLMRKVDTAVTDTVSSDDGAFSIADWITVQLKNGQALKTPELKVARGHWSVPLSRDELWRKFEDCTTGALPPAASAKLFESLQTIERLNSLRDLARAA
jgi:2-methylcitrate dehydratase PrpD